MCLCLTSLCKERKMAALKSKWVTLSLMIRVQELSIVHQALGNKITRCVYQKESSTLTILLFQLTKTESSLRSVLHTKTFTSRMPIKSLSTTSSRKEGWSKAVPKCITILTVGEAILP